MGSVIVMEPRILAVLPLLLAHPAAAQEPCDGWNTFAFFRNATAETVAECLDAGANPNARAEEGVSARDRGATPLHLASRYCRDPGAITVLLAAGAEVDARDRDGATPLHVAAGNQRSPGVVEELAGATADLNARDESGNTPLHAAWFNPNPVVAHRLLELGADPTARNDRGQIADPMSCEHWNTEVFARIATLEAWDACLDAGADVNARDGAGNSPLLLALDVGAPGRPGPELVALVRKLTERGADPNARNSWTTPLDLAAGIVEAPGLIEVLLRAGADVSPSRGWSPLHLAARYGNSATIAALLAGGAEVDADYSGETPLHWAIEEKRPANVAALLEAGADPGRRTRRGTTPLHEAAVWPPRRWGSSEVSQDRDSAMIVALVVAGADVNARNNWGETPLHTATRNGHAPVVDKLLALGAHPGAEDELGRPPRPMVCDWTELGFFRRVPSEGVLGCLQSGADVHARAESGQTPLHLLAAQVGEYPLVAGVIDALVDAGADVNARDLSRSTPLHEAVQHPGPWTAVTAALLEAGADVNARDDRGFTPLHVSGSLAKASLLAEAGADLHAADSWGRTPMHLRLQRDHPRFVSWLLDLGSDTGARDHSGIVADPIGCERLNTGSFFHIAPVEIVAACIEAGADVNARSERLGGDLPRGSTPLHFAAAWSRDPAVVRFLVRGGGDVNTRDSDDYAPLHRAAGMSDHPGMIAVLLEVGAEARMWARGANPYRDWHETPLHEAAGRNANPAVTAALLEAGADVHARSEEGGRTPLHRAAWENPNPAVAMLLLEAGADLRARADYRIPHRGYLRGLTPLHAAAKANPAAFMALLNAGADPEALDDAGKTPMDYAREHGALRELEVVKRWGR